MPTYVYHCSSCDSTFEVEQRITADPLTSCECGASGTVKRVIQPIAVMFKGSGFHINDYSPSSAPAEPKTETKSETKPEPAAETPAPAAPATPATTTP